MAKRVISEPYTFDKDTKIVTVVGKVIRREQLLLIINARTNTVIYNFTDASLGVGSGYSISAVPNSETTIITLSSSVDTSSMNNTDPLSIIVDETNETFQPAETYMDPVQKMRVSTPQALIDTDFEYGTQPTKWETIALMNNRPSAFYDITSPLGVIPANGVVTAITPTGTGSRIVTIATTIVAVSNPFSLTLPIYIQDTTNPDCNGWFLPQTVTGASGSWGCTYFANAAITPSTTIYDSTKTYVWVGLFFTGAGIPTTSFNSGSTNVLCTTTNAHGLSVGDAIFVVGTTGTTPPNGNWIVKTTPASNTFTFDVITAPGTVPTLSNGATATVFPRTYGNSLHRPYDGGVNFTAGTPYHGNQLIRQTRRYFRYQSGKGVQFSTGSNFCPLLFVDSVTNGGSGQTVTVTTKYPHNLGAGASIVVSGTGDNAYNGTFTVLTTPTPVTLTYSCAPNTPSVAPATGWPISIGPKNWYGAQIRVGMFDSQNGFYFEYDGQTVYAVARRSTDQLSGYISALTAGTAVATGISTRWSKELLPGDNIVIRGSTYVVQSILSDTSMVIYPEYRGATSIASPSQVIISKTINTKIPQSAWNIDRADSTGISGFNLDITKMQMWYIDYAWYGAGAVRFGIKNQRGEVYYCHRIANANQKTEAYMRSGNLPARYEVNTNWPYTVLASTLSSSDTTMTVASNVGFPPAGTLCITGSGNTAAPIEYVTYTGKSGTTVFSGLTRGLSNLTGPGGLTGLGGTTATTFTVSNPNTTPTQVSLFAPQAGVTIGHWGSSVIMDGRYDDDKSFVFNYGMNTPIVYATAAQRYPVMSIRLAPSVDNGLTGLIGAREIINRMQLQPVSCGVYPTVAGVKVDILFNARVSGGTFAAVGGSSLAQAVTHANTATIAGGEVIYSFFAPAAGVSTQDITKVRDIGNSIMGGGNTLTYPTTDNNKYPDGPDTITIAVTPLASNASVVTRINWTEAQA